MTEQVDWNDGYTLMRALGAIVDFVQMTECVEDWEWLNNELLTDARCEIEEFFQLDAKRCDKILEAAGVDL